MTNTETRPMVWAVVVWKLPHGTFVALRTAEETIGPVGGCQLTTGETAEQVATRVTQEALGMEVGGWLRVSASEDMHVMVSTVVEAPFDLSEDAHWIDVDQLPLLSAFTPGFDLMVLWLALQGI